MNPCRSTAMLFLMLSPWVSAETLTYTGQASFLKQPPEAIAAFEGIKDAAYPKGLSGNRLTVDFVEAEGSKSVPLYVFGALSVAEAVKKNTVWLKRGRSGNLYGASSRNGEASGNTLMVGKGPAQADIAYGGASFYAEAKGNTVKILQGETALIAIHGGFSNDNAARGNTVSVREGKVSRMISGGSSQNGAAEKNAVYIAGGTLGQVYGGASLTGPVRGNLVRFSGREARGNQVVGGLVRAGLSVENAVDIRGGQVGSVTGGVAEKGRAVRNHVMIRGGQINGAITGGVVAAGEGQATANTVILNGPLTLGQDVWLRGGQVKTGEAFTGNRLHIEGPIPGVVAGLENFETLRFHLSPNTPPGAVMLNAGKGGVRLANERGKITSAIELEFPRPLKRLKEGDVITLIRSEKKIAAPPENRPILREEFPGAGKNARRYRFRVDLSDDGKELWATLVEAPTVPRHSAFLAPARKNRK